MTFGSIATAMLVWAGSAPALAQPTSASAVRATSLVSAAGTEGNDSADDASFQGASSDGARVFFETTENLVAGDIDGLLDVYERSGEQMTLVSAPGAGGYGGAQEAVFGGASSDGSRLFFTTSENLVGSDADGLLDVYERSSGETTLVSVAGEGPGGIAQDVYFADASSDGTRVFIHTMENLVGADTDGLGDVYERSGGQTTLVSAPGVGASGSTNNHIGFGGISSDGTRVFLNAYENLVGSDTDGLSDVYERSGGQTTLISGPGFARNGPAGSAVFVDASSDGTRVFFVTEENLVGGDTDGLNDVYERSGGLTRPISAPGVGASGDFKSARFAGASSDGSRVFFRTAEGLVGADTDRLNDVYERSGGQTTLVSASGPGANGPAAEAFFRGASSDGTQVFLETTENLIGADANGLADIYERSGGQTTLVSAPGVGASGSDRDASFAGASSDGTRVFFNTLENLAGGDTDGQGDIYERSGGQTTLVSSPGAGANGAAYDTSFAGASSDGARVFFETAERLVGADADGSLDVYESRVMAAPIGDDGGGETADGDGPDTTAPDTTIESKRRRLTKPQARIRFSSSEPGSSFECRLDKRPFKPCGSPKKLKRLKDGRHRFFVRAIDAAGNTDPSPAKLRFRVSLPPTPGS